MNNMPVLKLLFIINPGSGAKSTDWPALVKEKCTISQCSFEMFELPEHCGVEELIAKIKEYDPAKVIAVGGDGTVNLLAQCLLNTKIPLGILPGGSANGMAKELSIPMDPDKALEVCLNGVSKNIHIININDRFCVHLSDLGFNAYVTKKFKALKKRGIWGYIKAGWRIFWNQPMLRVNIQMNEKEISRKAIMIVIANATKYGTGVVINPAGKLDDEVFEVIVVKRISFFQSLKMLVTHNAFDTNKTEVFTSNAVQIYPNKKTHFQVDGEYLGKVNMVKASIILNALQLIVPADTNEIKNND